MALELVTGSLLRSPQEIIRMYRARKGQFRERNMMYAKLLQYYFGKHKDAGGATTHDIMSMDGRGKPMLRDLGVSLSLDRRYIANRMMPIVEDYQALVGSMPIIRVEAASPEEKDEQQAEKETRYLYSTYGPRMSNMDWHHAYAGFCLSCMGDALYVPDVDPKSGRIMVSAEHPMFAFPSFWGGGPRRWELYDLITHYVWAREDIWRHFNYDTGSDSPADNIVVTYMSPEQRTIVLAQRRDNDYRAREILAEVHWNLDFCPAVWVRNKMNGEYGSSDIQPVLGLQDYYDFLLNVMADGVVEMTYPMRMVRNPVDQENGPLTYGPGATVEVGPEGDLKVLSPTPAPQAAMMLMHQALEDMNVGSGTSQIRQEGMPDRSNVSGRAIQSAQGPQATRVDLKQVLLGAGLAQLNYHVLAMQEKAPLTPRKFDIFGAMRGTVFREEFVPAEDIAGWYENTVRWDQMVGVNQQQRLAYGVEGKQNQIFDDLTAMEMAGIQNPMEMRKKIAKSVLVQAQLQNEANKAVQGGPEPGALALGPTGVSSPKGGGGPPTVGAPAAGTGGPRIPPPVFQPPPRPAPGGAPPVPPGAGTPALGVPPGLPGGVPVGASLEKVKQAIAPIAPMLKGGVYAVGDLAQAGQSPRVTLRITDQGDYRIVKQAVLPLDPKPEIRYVSEANLPPEAVRLDFSPGNQQAPPGGPGGPGGALAALAGAIGAGAGPGAPPGGPPR